MCFFCFYFRSPRSIQMCIRWFVVNLNWYFHNGSGIHLANRCIESEFRKFKYSGNLYVETHTDCSRQIGEFSCVLLHICSRFFLSLSNIFFHYYSKYLSCIVVICCALCRFIYTYTINIYTLF